MTKEMMKCPDGTYLEIGVIGLSELERSSMRDSKFKIACKKIWVFTRNFIRRKEMVLVRILKALKTIITSR